MPRSQKEGDVGKHGRVSVMFPRPAVQTWDHVCGESDCRRALCNTVGCKDVDSAVLCPGEEKAPSPQLGTDHSRFSEH